MSSFTFRSNRAAVTAKQDAAVTGALREIGFAWRAKAVLRTPVHTGFLRATLASAVENDGGTHSEQHEGGTVTFQKPLVGRGTVQLGSIAEYAAAVHEDLTANRRVGGPKFIEAPMREEATRWQALLAKAVRSAS